MTSPSPSVAAVVPPLSPSPPPPEVSPEPVTAVAASIGSSHDATARKDEEAAAWAKLVQRYEDGTSAIDMTTAPVDRPADCVFDGDHDQDDGSRTAHRSSPSACNTEPLTLPEQGADVDFAREFYKREGYLPALRSPREQERRRVLRRYSLYDVGRVSAIDDLAALARDVFDVDVVVINVVLDDRVLLVSTSGWDENERDPSTPQPVVPLTASFCPHGMAKPSSAGCFQLPNTSQDWRFRRSPLVQEGNGRIGFFASSNIYLPAGAPASAPAEADADSLPVGSLCLIHPTPRPKLTERQERMLKQFATMAAKEFELVFELQRRLATDGQQDYMRHLLTSLIVWPSRNLVSSATTLPCNFTGTAAELQRWTGSDFAFILDLRGFNHTPSGDDSSPSSSSSSSSVYAASAPHSAAPSRPASSQSARGTPLTSPNGLNARDGSLTPRKASAPNRRDARLHGPGSITVMDVECGDSGATTAESKQEWESRVNSDVGINSIAQALADWHHTGQIAFSVPVSTPSDPNPVLDTPLLKIVTPDTKALVAVPVFDHEGEPAIYVVVGSRIQHFQYEVTDQRFVQSVGALLVAGMLQERILAADKAKQAFLSQVSHELRTPMFAIGSQLELIRTMTEPSALASIDPLLSVAEICLTSLREVLDDTLDVSKLNNGGQVAATLVTVELESLVIDVVKSCWHKAKRLAALRAGDESEGNSSAVEKVDVLLRTSLPEGTKAKVDVGGLKRVLINLFGNSLKFCSRGSITLSVAPDGPCTQGVRRVRFEVEDTGKGMSREFLRDHLFVAFRQEDSFTNGAGLGVSIAESIVKRMGGTLRYRSAPGRGTTATVVVPLEGITATDLAKDLRTPITRNLSEELASLFDPQSCSPASSLDLKGRPSVEEASDRVEDEERTGSFAQGAKKTLVSAVPVDKPVNSTPAQSAPASPARVLVVDDNSIARRILVTFLKTRKIPFAEASGGAQAVKLFQSFRPNLVWCDIQMPEVDGIQATREMREFEVQEGLVPARIVAISGLDSTLGEHSSVLTSGQVDHWLVKSGSSLRELAADLAEYVEVLMRDAEGGDVSEKAADLEHRISDGGPDGVHDGPNGDHIGPNGVNGVHTGDVLPPAHSKP